MSNFVLDKGFTLLSTYNSSAVAGALAKRFVKLVSNQTVDLNVLATTRSIGVLMENVDQAKIATGKVVADVRLMGIARVVAGAAFAVGVEVGSDTTGRAITAVSTNYILGVALWPAANAGDEVDILLTQGTLKA